MGLDTTHNCFHGAYSSFMRFRKEVCKTAGLGNLDDYEGFGGSKVWDVTHTLYPFLTHSDCDGELSVEECIKSKHGLESVLHDVSEIYKAYVTQFIEGLTEAINNNETVEFR